MEEIFMDSEDLFLRVGGAFLILLVMFSIVDGLRLIRGRFRWRR